MASRGGGMMRVEVLSGDIEEWRLMNALLSGRPAPLMDAESRTARTGQGELFQEA
ncbi:MAG: hypothetical protein GXP49_14985, partial [Deltaproteobacteria bacterium]|nr:hypothetical protein [Deltaproteobacteria bacterium]